MQVECDPKKSAANLKKHGVSFQEAETVFYDPLGLTCEDDEAQGETRFITVGQGGLGRVLAVAWTQRAESIRLISAREATRNERRAYES
ncbi:MAG: BrnT family toxin [Betaproteobacteria bacterium]|nr:BrnT family toxin [Betaproteobacteria bacterium]